jgi:hypothetical protein
VFDVQASRVSGTEMEKYVKKANAAPVVGQEAPIIRKKVGIYADFKELEN